MPDVPGTARSDRHPFPAVNPEDGSKFEVFITARKAARVARRGKGAVLEMAHTVSEVLRSPQSIHEGIRKDEDERDNDGDVDSWLCYCGHPKSYYNPNEERPQPSSPGEVFLVFVNKDRVAYHWRWEDADEDGSGCPDGHETRFHKRRL